MKKELTPDELVELKALRAVAAERDGVEALRALIVYAVLLADEATLRAIAALLEG